MFGTVSASALDKPTAMTFLHIVLLSVAVAVIALAPLGWGWRVLVALILILVAPVATVLYRKRTSIHRFSLIHATLLYELYFLARINALLMMAVRRAQASQP